MPATMILGAQWGDEGKGKITDYFSDNADLIVRFQGGTNAGHTIVIGNETYKLHLIPSGILHPEKTSIIANGVVLDPEVLINEIKNFQLRALTKSGETKWLEFDSRTIPFGDGLADLTSIVDITERKLAEQKLQESEKVLNDCHSGACGGHSSGYATAQKILRASYYSQLYLMIVLLLSRVVMHAIFFTAKKNYHLHHCILSSLLDHLKNGALIL